MNYLITQTKLIEVLPDSEHAITCKKLLGVKLNTFLKRNGVRVKIHLDCMAVEFYGKLVQYQINAVTRLLRKNTIHKLVLPDRVVERFTRPIKSFKI